MPSWTLIDIEVLEKSIASGTLKVKYTDKEVEYRSLEEMLKILKMMKDSLDVDADSLKGRRYASHSKGLK